MIPPTPRPAPDRDLVSPVDRQIADALRHAGQSQGAVPEDVAARHLAAITALAADHIHMAARPATPTWGSRIRRVAGLTIVKVAVAAGAAAAATGGLAVEGYLPDPVQGAVADVARWVGIDLPRPNPATEPAMSDSANVDRVEDGPPPGTGADDPAGHRADPSSPPTNDRAVPQLPADPSPPANDRAGADNPADLPADSRSSANDDTDPPTEHPRNDKAPEVDGRDAPLPRPPASSLQSHEVDGAGDRETRS